MDGLTIVTGGAGFLGSHLVDLLVAQGETVRVVERPGAAVDHLPSSVEIVRADIRDPRAVKVALRRARKVYHLAANPNLWVRDRGEFDAVNHRGAVNVLDAAIAEGAERILHVSTESILTCARATGSIAEDVVVTEADAVGPYCLSKLRAERAAMDRAQAGHPVLIANPTMPVGPGDRGLSPPSRLIRDYLRSAVPAIVDCTLNLIDARDAAEGLRLTLEKGQPGRRYLLGGTNLTLAELFARLESLTGVPAPHRKVPYPLALGFAIFSEYWADFVTGRSPQATITGLRLTRRTMHFDCSLTLADLGLAVRPIDVSLADAVVWLQTHFQPTARLSRKSQIGRNLLARRQHAD
jgi:dihydroflavonol-4-reductase